MAPRIVVSLLLLQTIPLLAADPHAIHQFSRKELTGTYFSEGANHGDLNNDGVEDIVYGPYWFAGPDYGKPREIYAPVPQNMEAYADHFFCWVHDFDQDGWRDILVVGFPGTPAFVYQNPGSSKHGAPWPKHEVADWVSNESPQFTDLLDDDRPELVCTRDGYYGYLTPDWDTPFQHWVFHRISEQVATPRFGHGLGVGDINGDGRHDILTHNGWYAQPGKSAIDRPWAFHSFDFAPGGADMFAYDVDGDGDNDVITSLDAHAYGLAWYEQVREDDGITFRQHLIMGSTREENKYGVLFTELHSVSLADMDGDGLLDIVTGKTYWSHHRQSPLWDAGAVVYWFQLVRGDDGVDWVPHQADGEAGIGRQVVVGDLNGDQLPDIIVGGMKGCHLLLHSTHQVDEHVWLEAQPQKFKGLADGLSPQEAAAQMTPRPGFQVQLAAGEPMVHQPVAFTMDHRGRVWVAEAYTYPQRAPEGEGKDKIIILEDTDLDGTLDSRKEFATGLNLVSGLEVGFGGVWVGAAPYLMFIPDQDGDDVPDHDPKILLDGFGYQDTHETLNAFIWGPDGWLYGCHGVFTHSRVGKPGTPDEDRTPLNAAVWRYHPVRHEFDVFAQGSSNPWGVDFNDHGHAFITACVIPHLFHVIQGARYQRQGGQHFNSHTYDDIKTIADHLHYSGRIQDHAWWGHQPDVNPSVSAAGGGHAHCGAMIYLADNWPEQYRDSLYFNNIHGNRVNNDILERTGSGYVGRHGPDFLMANDKWYRGINLKYGPDGSVHLIDWYDPNACHRVDPTIWDRSNGRVYRVSYGTVPPVRVDLAVNTSVELAELQLHENEWYVRMARRLLQEEYAQLTRGKVSNRAGLSAARERLTEIFQTHESETRRLRALWSLHVSGGVDSTILMTATHDPDDSVRGFALQLALEQHSESNLEVSTEMLSRMEAMAARDPSPLARLYVASALQRLPHEARWPIASALLQHAEDVEDHNLPLMIWYGVEPLVAADPARALALAADAKIPRIRQFLWRRVASEEPRLGLVLDLIVAASDTDRHQILDAVQAAFAGRVGMPMPDAWGRAYESLLASSDVSLRDKADRVALALGDRRILPRMRETLVQTDLPIEQRREALDVLVEGRDADAATALLSVLGEPELRGAAIRALAAYDSPECSQELLRRYFEFDAAQRQDAINTLAARRRSAVSLIDAIEAKTIPRTDVHAFAIRQLERFEDPLLLERLQRVWGTIRESSADKKLRIEELRELVTDSPAGDMGRGRVTFNKVCASCHVLFGTGNAIGPDITGSNRANVEYLLENVVDPSSVVSKDYQMSVFVLNDGRVVTGMITQESDSAVTIRTVNDTLLLAKADVDQRELSMLSLMPEGLLDQLNKEEIVDLVAYLASPSQVPPRYPAAPLDASGNVPGAIEGESMAIAGKSAGTVESQSMTGFTGDRWSGGSQLWWTGAKPGDRLDLTFNVAKSGQYRVELVMTRARDYGNFQLHLDGKTLGEPYDLFHASQVVTTGVVESSPWSLEAGEHTLSIQITGANPQAIASYMFGLDYVRIIEIHPE